MNKKILVVDNDELILTFMTDLLEQEGHEVRTAVDGLSALDMLMTFTPEVMFIDLVMPNINGEQLCRIIEKMPSLTGARIVILSATVTENSSNLDALGAHTAIAKGPFDQMGKQVLAALKQSDRPPSIGAPERIIGSKGISGRAITEELISAKGHLETILSNLSEGIIELEPDGRIVLANPAALCYMASSEEALLGSTFLECMDEPNRRRIEDLFSKILVGGSKKATLDVPLPMNGRYISFTLLRVQKKAATHVVVVLKDFTEIKKAERLLKERHQALERERLTQIIDFLPDATMVIDLDGKVIAWNRAIEQMTGVKARDMIGKGDHEYAIPFYGERRPVLIDLVGQWNKEIEEKYQYVKQVGEALISETYDPLINPGGYLWNKASLLYDNAGKVIGAIESIRDITEMRLYERALRESEEKYRQLVENANVAIFITQDHRVKFANPKTEALTGYSGRELSGIHFADLIHPEDRSRVLQKRLKELNGETFQCSCTFRILNSSGDVVSAELNSVRIEWENRWGTLNFLKDITQQKKLEAQLRQAEKMEAIGTLAGGVAHDFNNLLMAIQGQAAIARMGKDASHPDFKHLRRIEAHVESAVNLTRQLLGFARGGKYEVKPTDLNALVRDVNQMFGRTRKEINMTGRYGKHLWSVEVDRGQIEQVLLNLYINAWQAMPEGGDLTVETENVILDDESVKPSFAGSGKYVKISVKDTGIGMDSTTRKKIFDPFFTTKEMGRGTGLGLSSAYGIIKSHAGFINVYSEKGHGSIFTVFLPASEKAIIEEKRPAGEALKGFETVLFVDDEAMNVEIAEKFLEVLGYKSFVAGSGKEAVEIYGKHQDEIDVVILDIIMPNMSGGEVYERIKSINPSVKVLLSSGYTIDDVAKKLMNRGCNGFIQKPFKLKDFSQKLREVLDGSDRTEFQLVKQNGCE